MNDICLVINDIYKLSGRYPYCWDPRPLIQHDMVVIFYMKMSETCSNKKIKRI